MSTHTYNYIYEFPPRMATAHQFIRLRNHPVHPPSLSAEKCVRTHTNASPTHAFRIPVAGAGRFYASLYVCSLRVCVIVMKPFSEGGCGDACCRKGGLCIYIGTHTTYSSRVGLTCVVIFLPHHTTIRRVHGGVCLVHTYIRLCPL